MRLPRLPFLLALALAVPLRAFALGGAPDPGAGTPPGGAALSVDATLAQCGVLGAKVACEIDVSFDAVDGATSYALSVTRPDGSVVDEGEATPGTTAIWVEYAGDGTYTVQVSAYGEAPSSGQRHVVARAKAAAGGGERAAQAPARGGQAGATAARAGERSAPQPPAAGGSDGVEPATTTGTTSTTTTPGASEGTTTSPDPGAASAPGPDATSATTPAPGTAPATP